MVTISLIATGGGLGDLQDFMFTVDDANQYTFIVLSYHEGQSDNITSITVDGNNLSSIANGGDGNTTHYVYSLAGLSAGQHDFTIQTSGGTYRYGYAILKVLGWDATLTESQLTGAGTTAALSLETRTPDTVLSILTVDTNVTVTSGDNLLQSSFAGAVPLRVRFATSYDNSGSISWTLNTSQAWVLTILRLRGTDFHVGTPSHTADPSHFGLNSGIGTPGRIIVNP